MESSLFDSDFLSVLLPQVGAWALRAFPVVFILIAEIFWAARSKAKTPLLMLFFSIMGLILGFANTVTTAFMISGDFVPTNFTTIQLVFHGIHMFNDLLWGISFIAAVFVTIPKAKKSSDNN